MKKDKFKYLTKHFFSRLFGFEENIDITDDVMVLHRRNIVIKNIIFLSNIIYSMILFFIAAVNNEPSDWLFSALSFPFTFFLNNVINRLIFGERHDKTKQEVAMYVEAIYMFISAILIYARLYGNFETAAYILIYYSVVVISLYQSKRLIMWTFQGMIAGITFIHFVWTYQLTELYQGLSVGEFLKQFIPTEEAQDFYLRIVLFTVFMVVIYAIVSMGSYMQEERKKELIKRREVQTDFTTIVTDLYAVVLSSKRAFMDRQHIDLVSKMSSRLGAYYGLSTKQIEHIEAYAIIHMRAHEIEDLVQHGIESEDYEDLKKKTSLGTLIAKRIQLAQKAEDIARAHIEGVANEKFVKEMLLIQPQVESQVILLADLYVTMRSLKSYKRPYPNSAVIQLFEKNFYVYFEGALVERFLKFKTDFEKIYNEY
ncbi:hypothetical protein N7603_02760 [Acholeplasma vituli]|uniref:HD-GYP domain-containing protein n=1 Tax=Paracholeplasma vituli TaxID=69473 RepID=A0ABT2PUF2_9MOLU|nr:hypothetical protein [Paracholeplasma vituli]MCU0104571.1 hypothetical protein [Paracholeplasma vituli]